MQGERSLFFFLPLNCLTFLKSRPWEVIWKADLILLPAVLTVQCTLMPLSVKLSKVFIRQSIAYPRHCKTMTQEWEPGGCHGYDGEQYSKVWFFGLILAAIPISALWFQTIHEKHKVSKLMWSADADQQACNGDFKEEITYCEICYGSMSCWVLIWGSTRNGARETAWSVPSVNYFTPCLCLFAALLSRSLRWKVHMPLSWGNGWIF